MTKSKWQLFLEVMSVTFFMFMVFGIGPTGIILMIYASLTSNIGLALSLLYIAYIFWDRDCSETGGRRSNWFRGVACWRYFRSYFPVELHKTAELPPDKNYVIATFPHGIYPMGVSSCFATEAHNLEGLYPGIKFYLGTLKFPFMMPFVGQFMRMMGAVSCSAESANWVLGRGTGKVFVLVVGGAAESLHNHPGVYKTVLKKRSGFVKLAMKNGASLVPVIAFGEVDAYEIHNYGAPLNKFQTFCREKVGVIPMRLYGAGLFGLLPRRVPIHIVVGSPIKVDKNENPRQEEVDKVHQAFVTGYMNLFNAEKHKYLNDPDTELQFV